MLKKSMKRDTMHLSQDALLLEWLTTYQIHAIELIIKESASRICFSILVIVDK